MGTLCMCTVISQWSGWDLFEDPSDAVFTGLALVVSVLVTCVGGVCGVVALSIRDDRAPAIVPTLCNLLLGAAIVGIVLLGSLA